MSEPSATSSPGEAWIAGTFEGDYVAEASAAADGGKLGARWFKVELVRGTVSEPELCDGPPDDPAPLPLRQRVLEHCYFALRGAAELARAPLFGVELHSWRQVDEDERDGKIYGKIRGVLYGKIPATAPADVSLNDPERIVFEKQAAVWQNVGVIRHPQRGARDVPARGAGSGSLAPGRGSLVDLPFGVAGRGRAGRAQVSRSGCLALLGMIAVLALLPALLSGLSGGTRDHTGLILLGMFALLLLAMLRASARSGRRVVQRMAGMSFLALIALALRAGCPAFNAPGGSSNGSLNGSSRSVEAPARERLTVTEALRQPEAFFGDPRRRIYLSEDVLFDFDSNALKQPVSEELGALAQLLRDAPTRRVTIEGHADTLGSPARNLVLSRRRAEAVRDWLVYQAHVNPDQLATLGLGSAQPLVFGGDAEAQRINRRVEVRASATDERR